MKKFIVRIPPDVAEFLRHLSPEIKSKIRKALQAIETDPYLGKPLKERLKGLWSYRVSQYRIVYEIKAKEILVEIVDVGERKIIYSKIASILKRI